MDEFERQLAAAIKAAASDAPVDIDPMAIPSGGPARNRRAVLAPIAAGVLVAGAAAGLVAISDRGGSKHPGSSATEISPQPAPHGFRDSEFGIAQPPQGAMGPGYPRNPTCRAGQVTASAATRSTPGGVFGVVRLRGSVLKHENGRPVRCSLSVEHGPAGLVGTDGRHLDVALASGDPTNPPENSRSDIPLHFGDAIWGFAWLGSYCGPQAVAVEMDAGTGPLRVPLEGPQPPCESADGHASLIDGIAGAPGQPVLPPRPEYSRLRLAARIRPGTSSARLAPIDLTLSVVGTDPVVLDPCPSYDGMYSVSHGGGETVSGSGGHLPCTDRVVVVRPDRPMRFTVPPIRFVAHAKPGSTVGLDFGIAGVPELHLETIAH